MKLNGEYYLHASFRKAVEERKAEGVLGIDINERSIYLALIKPNKARFIKVDVSKVKNVRDRYFRKRRRVQSRASGRAKAMLLAKYFGRERRVNDILHKASKIITNLIAKEGREEYG